MSDSQQQLPPIAEAMEAELANMVPVAPRSPLRQFLLIVAISLGFAGAVLAMIAVRTELPPSPWPWLVWLAALALGFTVPLYLAIVPRRGSALPRVRAATLMSLVISGVVLAGSFYLSTDGGRSAWASVAGGAACFRMSAVMALVPVGAVAWVLRRSFFLPSRWLAMALGISCGCLGVTAIELHCRNHELWHLVATHVGVVVIAALLAALFVPKALAAD